jgi:CubicO group peptidase (beta-lactamase class C family)
VIEDGALVYAQGFGVLQAGSDMPVTADTVFSAGSVSKVATAFLTLNLIQDGLLDLDEPISRAVPDWSPAPDSPYADALLTPRMVLSHTGGLNLHGFADFQPGDPLPSLAQTLNGAAPARHAALEIQARPGEAFRYSGGGYTLLQGLIAHRAGAPFERVASQALFAPLGLTRSTFANPLPEDHGDIARAHDRNGQPTALPRGYESMPEMAASGLWTSAADLGRLVAEMITAYRGQSAYLHPELGQAMMTRVAPSEHGLGPRLQGRLFHHGGANDSYRTWIEGDLVTGDGLVVLTNGANGMELAIEIRNAVNDVMGWSVNPPIALPQLPVSAAQLAGLQGVYGIDPHQPAAQQAQLAQPPFNLDLTVIAEGEQLFISYDGGENRAPLTPLAPNRFVLTSFPTRLGAFEVLFHTDAFGAVRAVEAHMPGAQLTYLPR